MYVIKINIYFFLFIFLFSCKNPSKEIKTSYNGENKIDSIFIDGKLYQIKSYKYEVVPDGEYKTFYNNGNIKEDYFIKLTKKDGKYLEYYPSGNIKSDLYYKEDVLDDAAEYYYDLKPDTILATYEGDTFVMPIFKMKQYLFFYKGKCEFKATYNKETTPLSIEGKIFTIDETSKDKISDLNFVHPINFALTTKVLKVNLIDGERINLNIGRKIPWFVYYSDSLQKPPIQFHLEDNAEYIIYATLNDSYSGLALDDSLIINK